MSLEIMPSHSRSFEITTFSEACVSIPFSIPLWLRLIYCALFLRYSTSNNGGHLKQSESWVIQGHWKWHHSIDCIHSILFYRRLLSSCNSVMRISLRIKQGFILSLLAKYNIQSLSLPTYWIKDCVWNSFVETSIYSLCAGHITVSV